MTGSTGETPAGQQQELLREMRELRREIASLRAELRPASVSGRAGGDEASRHAFGSAAGAPAAKPAATRGSPGSGLPDHHDD